MRRRRSSGAVVALATAVALVARPPAAAAQADVAVEGALFLLFPVGARSVGTGQATAAVQSGSESVWWNPAGIARQPSAEAAIHHSQSVIGTGDALTVVLPSQSLGVLAASIDIFDYGTLGNTGDGPEVIGTILPRSFVYAATYAATAGRRLNVGVTYKVLQFRVDCTGPCPPALTDVATTSALDAGIQYDFRRAAPFVIGAALRNVGPRLQLNDSPQADPLPARLQIGALYHVADVARVYRGTTLDLAGDFVDTPSFRSPSARAGADLSYQSRFHLRGGYVFRADDASGPSVGLGVVAGSFVLDLARQFAGLSADAGEAPTYLSLRYLF